MRKSKLIEKGIRIPREEADKLMEEGVARIYHLDSIFFSGFFEAESGGRLDTILIILDEGYFVRAREDLVKSDDEILVGFVEDGEKPPNFEDVFKVREY